MEARVIPIIAPLFSPEPSGDGMRKLEGTSVALDGVAKAGTAGRSNAVGVVMEVTVEVGADTDSAARVRLTEVVGVERVGDVNAGGAPPVAVRLKD